MATPITLYVAGALLLIATSIDHATAQPLLVPPPAYQMAAQQAGISPTVLYAIALQESGLKRGSRLVPWPWTLNVAGAPQRYKNHQEACQGLLRALRKTTPTRIDAGLGQINLGYQKHRYLHPCELLDPYRNLAIAAQILREQYKPGEDVLLAIGRYHRPAGGQPAARYRRSVIHHLSRLQDEPAAKQTPNRRSP